jgi:phosphatidylinositol alpha 1,6-mannosyltransferase
MPVATSRSEAVRCYVALGDSFTSGLEEDRAFRWPDAVARALHARRYENLAWVGATSHDVEEGQLGRALELEPDLVSLVCGANDVLYSVRPDARVYADRLSSMFARIRAAVPRAQVVTATYPDLSRFLELRERTAARVRGGMQQFNDACLSVARRYGVLCLDWSDHPQTDEPDYRHDDGFHPSEEGHRRAAFEVLHALEASLGLTTRLKERTA